jgi:quercetin dioxygenase-like cupin family protein
MKNCTGPIMFAATLALVLPYSQSAFAQSAAKSIVNPAQDVKWKDAGVPGVANAVVQGDMTKGASHFYLKYASGFVAPLHHHSPDHYVTTITGNLVLIVDGKEHRLSPGSYFALTGKAKHAARCEGTQECVMFVDARGPWDVVLAKMKADK